MGILNLVTPHYLPSFRLLISGLASIFILGCFQSGQTTGAPSSYPDNSLPQSHQSSFVEPITYPSLCSQGEAATVTKIIDGDTIDVLLANGTEERVRLIGIDTPERGETCYSEATERHRTLVGDGDVTLVQDTNNRDKYDRLVRYVCSARGVFIEAQLVAEGFAVPYRYYPDVKYADFLQQLGAEAVDSQRGCLYSESMQDSDPTGTSCCRVCRTGQACGDSCIPYDVTCRLKPGCACQG